MRKLKLLLVSSIVAVSSLSLAPPANAMVCMDGLDDACRVVATVVCGVVAKGKPCLN